MTATMIANPPTEKQLAFYTKLVDERRGQEAVDEVVSHIDTDMLNRKEISGLIDWLLKQPKTPKPAAEAAEAVGAVEDGMYKNPDTGEIFKVQRAKLGSNQLYAKKLVVEGTTDNYNVRFVYSPGLVRMISPSHKMSVEDAMAFGQLYGVCCRCGSDLTDEQSIQRGIGPVCYGKFV